MSKSCCFIGHKEIEETDGLKIRLIRTIKILIKRYNVYRFLFGDRSKFNNLCLEIVWQLKQEFPNIKIISYPSNDWYRGQEKENIEFIERIFKIKQIKYDDYIYLEYYGKSTYVQRNEKLINDSDYCVFYFNPNYEPKIKTCKHSLKVSRKSGTRIAFDFAIQRKREVINIYNNKK